MKQHLYTVVSVIYCKGYLHVVQYERNQTKMLPFLDSTRTRRVFRIANYEYAFGLKYDEHVWHKSYSRSIEIHYWRQHVVFALVLA
jgi:hypothetical protein